MILLVALTTLGMAVVESDVTGQVESVLLALRTGGCELSIADGSGEVWVSQTPDGGVHIASPGQQIPDLPARVAELLATKGQPFEVRGQDQYFAQRIYIGLAGRGVTIFARLSE